MAGLVWVDVRGTLLRGFHTPPGRMVETYRRGVVEPGGDVRGLDLGSWSLPMVMRDEMGLWEM